MPRNDATTADRIQQWACTAFIAAFALTGVALAAWLLCHL